MKSVLARFGLGCVLLVLAGCAGVSRKPTPQADTGAVATVGSDWSLQGRVAVRTAGEGGSGQLRWHQSGRDFEITLTAPITRQGWRLSRQGGGARLEGLGADALQGPDAEALLWQATGWSLPVDAMSAWVRGEPASADAVFERDAAGRLLWLQEDGWRVDYREWDAASPARPRRIFASRGEASVRLVIEAWQ